MTSGTNESIDLVAKRLLAVRLELGLSQQEFAEALGLTLRAAQNYERGVRKVPADVLSKLTLRFDIDHTWVMEGPEERPRRIANSGLDQETLARAVAVVQRALTETSTNANPQQIARMTAAVYKFYMYNASGVGSEDLIQSLVSEMR